METIFQCDTITSAFSRPGYVVEKTESEGSLKGETYFYQELLQ